MFDRGEHKIVFQLGVAWWDRALSNLVWREVSLPTAHVALAAPKSCWGRAAPWERQGWAAGSGQIGFKANTKQLSLGTCSSPLPCTPAGTV